MNRNERTKHAIEILGSNIANAKTGCEVIGIGHTEFTIMFLRIAIKGAIFVMRQSKANDDEIRQIIHDLVNRALSSTPKVNHDSES